MLDITLDSQLSNYTHYETCICREQIREPTSFYDVIECCFNVLTFFKKAIDTNDKDKCMTIFSRIVSFIFRPFPLRDRCKR